MIKLKGLQPNDIISFQYGDQRIQARVLKNNGTSITWIALSWRKGCEETFDYNTLRIRNVVYQGEYRPWWKRLLTLNFSSIDY